MQAFVNHCPKCGSRDAYCDDSRSKGDMSCMVCRACGHTDTVDSYRRDAEWLVEEKASETQRSTVKKRS